MNVTILTPAHNFLATIWPFIEILSSLVQLGYRPIVKCIMQIYINRYYTIMWKLIEKQREYGKLIEDACQGLYWT